MRRIERVASRRVIGGAWSSKRIAATVTGCVTAVGAVRMTVAGAGFETETCDASSASGEAGAQAVTSWQQPDTSATPAARWQHFFGAQNCIPAEGRTPPTSRTAVSTKARRIVEPNRW